MIHLNIAYFPIQDVEIVEPGPEVYRGEARMLRQAAAEFEETAASLKGESRLEWLRDARFCRDEAGHFESIARRIEFHDAVRAGVAKR